MPNDAAYPYRDPQASFPPTCWPISKPPAKVVITNYHAFQLRETMAAPKLSKAILGGRSGPVQTLESEGLMRSARDHA